jgi:competence protein ComEA
VEDPQRPFAPLGFDERLRAWMAWFGFGRIIGSAIAMVVVCAGGYWLVRTPAPPTEASLPRAGIPTTTLTELPAGDGAATTVASSAAQVPAPTSVVVHVAGAVVAPGVYTLDIGARADDAIDAAGGVVAGAEPDALNLAAPLSDGTRIYVPMEGEEVPVAVLSSGGPPTGESTVGVPPAPNSTRCRASARQPRWRS